MREADTPIVDMLTLRRDLYFVMSLLLADKEVAKIPNVTDWTKAFHENEVRRLMLWVATATRSLLGSFETKDTKKKDIEEKVCGEYWANFPKGEQKPLLFRQACNSAIHATGIFPYKISEQDYRTSLPWQGKSGSGSRKIPAGFDADRTVDQYSDRITIRSFSGGKTTRAHLDIIRFVQITDTLINHFEEADNANR
ncbi:hypothetical protein [Candidatus Spongiihabitans sp.]|uniref:hypothetical protein n=1 Tax=Candidatus Spongiihabitans sp. TaxID=3101308 RepID=UPI003C6EC921